jgi:diadenosine tetraphosphate (Ap4A) HIT family hydrolase
MDEHSAIWKLVTDVRQRLLTGLKPDRVPDGIDAGQTVPHSHGHVIPRRKITTFPGFRGGIRWVDNAVYWKK